MRLPGGLLLVFSLVVASTAFASAPWTSVRPKARTGVVVSPKSVTAIRVSYRPDIRPRARGQGAPVLNGYAVASTRPAEDFFPPPADTYPLASSVPVFSSMRPSRRPNDLRVITPSQRGETTRVASTTAFVRGSARSICGDRRIKGTKISPIRGTRSGCGVANPVKVASIDGVVLSQGSIMDCTTAKALKSWVIKGLKPAVGKKGGGVRSLRVPSHYACRTRNSQPGAKISEHGKGRAIDISAIVLKDGTQLSVLDGWRSRGQSRILKKAHKAACGPFGTVLGPDANKYHRDHFHFDTARYRSGSYCR